MNKSKQMKWSNNNADDKMSMLESENYRLCTLVNDLISLNSEILEHILANDCSYVYLINKGTLGYDANIDDDFCQCRKISLDSFIIQEFQNKLKKIETDYRNNYGK